MASPPLQVEDQTDENFFDILVDEGDTGISRSGPSLFENEGSDETNAFSKLSIGEADAAKVDSSGNVDFGVNSERESGGGTVSASLDGHGDNLIAEESVSLTPVNVVQLNDFALQEKCELDSKSSNNSGSSGMGVKEVDWSSFNSASHLHNGSGTGSFSDFFNELGSSDFYGKEAGNSGVASNNVVGVPENMAGDFSSLSSIQHKEGQNYGSQIEQAIDGQDLNSSQYWENLYPGWRFDPNTGQWHQLDGYNATMDTQQNLDASIVSAGDGVATEQRSDDYYFQQTAQSVLGNVDCRASSFTDWNQGSQQNVVYPAHMVFDPQYPGWYYDTIAQEWQLLESYTSAMNQPTNVHHNQQSQDGIVSAADFLPEENHRIHGNFDQVGKFESQDRSSQGKVMGWAGSVSDSNQQHRNTWKTASLPNSGVISISDNYESHNPYDSSYHATNSADQQNQQMWFKPSGTATLPEQTSQSFGSVVNSNSILGSQTFIPAVNFSQHSNQHKQSQANRCISHPLILIVRNCRISYSSHLVLSSLMPPMRGGHLLGGLITPIKINHSHDTIITKAPKKPSLVLRMIVLTFAMLCGLYICSICLKQISTRTNFGLLNVQVIQRPCEPPIIETWEKLYVHYPQPKTFSRDECKCNPVRYFAILSTQRSRSGWFETLLNSHINISSNLEIFSVKVRRSNISTIVETLDKIYNLDWLTSASKNECTAAVGLKWMLNQGLMQHHEEIVEYFNTKGVSLIFLFRRNHLRRMISILANSCDQNAKPLNGTCEIIPFILNFQFLHLAIESGSIHFDV